MSNFISSLKNFNLPFLTYFDICFDLGTSNTRIAIKNKGIVLREATVIGVNNRLKEYVFFGNEARRIIGKTPEFIQIIKPIVNGVISDFDSETTLIKKFTEKSVEHYLKSYKLLKPPIRAICTIPTIATEIEQRAVEEVMAKLGAVKVYLIERPVAAAAGAEINIFTHQPNLVIDMGGGLIEMAIISGGGIVAKRTLKNGGEHMNSLISNYCYLKYGIVLGEMTVEELKINLLNFSGEEKTIAVRGKSLENGLPKSIRLKSSEIKEAVLSSFNQITDTVKELIEASPPEIVEDIYDRGIILAGELTHIEGIEKFLTEELKIQCMISSQGGNTTIYGLLAIAKDYESLVKLSVNTSSI